MGLAAGAMETISLVSTVAGAGISAIGAIQQGQATAAADRYQAQVAANNAQIAQQNAAMATQKGEIQAQQQGLKNRAQMGAIVSGMAANDVDVNTGSAAKVRSSADLTGLSDVQQIRQNAAIENYGYRSQSTSYQAESALETAGASNASTAGYLSAGTSLLGGAGRAAGQYASWMNQTTVPTTYGP